jgi:hypothetical protein
MVVFWTVPNRLTSIIINYCYKRGMGLRGWWGWGWGWHSFLLKLRLADAFFSSFTNSFFSSRVSLLISVFLYQKHLFPLIKRTKIKRSSFLKGTKKVSETKAGVSLITSLHVGGQELNESLKRICKRTCVVNKPARRLHAASDFSKKTHLNAAPLLTN